MLLFCVLLYCNFNRHECSIGVYFVEEHPHMTIGLIAEIVMVFCITFVSVKEIGLDVIVYETMY